MIDYFLDTSFLIPFFGMDIDISNIMEDYEKILETGGPTFGYSDVSLIEIRFLIERAIRRGAAEELRDEYAMGLKALEYNNQFQNVGISDIDSSELEIRFLTKYNYRDYFDRMIMVSAYNHSKYLVTMDNPMESVMKKFVREVDTRKSLFIRVISWKEMVRLLNWIPHRTT